MPVIRPVRLLWSRPLRSTLAALLVALLSTAPGAMVIPTRVEAETGAAPTAHHHTPPRAPGGHQHATTDDCCSLCVTSCIVCGAMICGGARDQTPHAATLRRTEHALARGRLFDRSFAYRLPPPLGPPR